MSGPLSQNSLQEPLDRVLVGTRSVAKSRGKRTVVTDYAQWRATVPELVSTDRFIESQGPHASALRDRALALGAGRFFLAYSDGG